MLLRNYFVTTAIGLALVSPAFAQNAPDPTTERDVIVVTGTRVENRSALETAVKAKGLSSWVLASDLARTARRNPTYATNPADIRAADARVRRR